ncbi:MAG TPA: NYN domain-containing protein [Ilumatobacter sp.]|nr:NYN domain-containing protein [Ilumatobacter sp.]
MAGGSIDVRYLRPALEFSVLMVREGQKLKPPIPYPPALRKYLKLNRLPAASLPAVRKIIESDETFRRRIAAGALPELVDPIGRVWLERPARWEDEIRRLVAEAEAEEAAADLARQLKRAEKRREAAETVAARARAEIVALSEQVTERDGVVEGLRSDVVKLADEIESLRAELIDPRLEARHARDREAAAVARLAAAESDRDDAVVARGTAEGVRDAVLADRAALSAERSELARLAAAAETLAEQLSALASPPASGRPAPARRKALPLPGGVMGDSDAVGEYLLRSGASVLVDGYNVAKLAWPDLDLAGQRVVLLDSVENLVKRFGCDVTVVFDGADVTGATADRRRVVRVVFSPEGVIADDVIRDEVRRLPASRPVVVVTNDRAIVHDVRAQGANTMSSDQMLSLMR